MSNFLKKIKNSFFGSSFSREAFEAYFNRLPNSIQVKWIRDGHFIVGKITDNECSYRTQGENADDFIDMVNDAIYTMHDIPEEYLEYIKKVKTYNPPLPEKEKLENAGIMGSVISLNKRRNNLKLA